MITSIDQLRALYAEPGERAVRKQQTQLDPHTQRFIALSPFCVVATGGVNGALLDASPRGGTPGFVKTPDAHTLLLPDSSGNNRLDTLSNLIADPRIALLFVIPGVDETLRINGTAQLREEPAFTDLFTAERQRPKLVIEVRVVEAYLHCSKAFMRSRLWKADAQVERAALPTMGQMIHDQTGLATAPESQAEMVARYQAQLDEEQIVGRAA